MSGQANFPTSIDDDVSLYDVVDSTTTLVAAHHNNIKEAVKAIEAKIGIHQTTSSTSLDYRLGSATGGHRHEGASGQGILINPSTIAVPSGGFPSGSSLHAHLMDGSLHTPTVLSGTGIASALGANTIFVPTQIAISGTGIATALTPNVIFVPTYTPRHLGLWQYQGSLMASVGFGVPFSFGRTMQVENIQARFRVPPSGATTALDVNIGPTSLWQASQDNRPIFPAGATYFGHASPNLITYPSGALVTVDVDAVGSNDPGQDLSITFVFRE